ncbi:hypothetical protein A1O3_05987 [Capronia epimyces CBS 606.96]|uniref:Xylanolytic transcriptional activator regulatory domain-containing protein n=1 Tax=Capronia epimyces CBS 606.96 TaxID=1182542 RepID=W9XXN7_9EURO|nr:uncharacterized protein A1O3_05987 [Capronia epimyces CBS 606.96]EXJ85312.1 hypothetical protein A1O3_05987 [Capronia epimyces CBS 606.96]
MTSVMDFQGSDSSNMIPYYGAFHLQQSSLPLPFPPQTRYPSRDEVAGGTSPKAINLADIPRTAADLMLKTYIGTLLVRHPCVEEQELLDSYANCFDSPQRASCYDIFIVCMALAISAATLTWRNEYHALSASAGFFAKAKEMLSHPATFDSEIRQIQVALLLTHYSFMNPTAVDVWYCIGDASRRCISLGLHKEAGPEMGLDERELNTRRRLFWTTCGLERTVCSQLRLPFVLDESDITTQMYHPHPQPRRGDRDDSGHRMSGKGPDGPESNHLWAFRLLETEVFSMTWVHTRQPQPHRKPTPNSTQFEEWEHSFQARMEEWCSYARRIEQQQKASFGSENVFDLSNLGRNLLQGRLHRPSPRVKYPSQESRLKYIKAAIGIVDHYTRYRSQQRFIYPWFAAHTLFEIAIVTLDTAWLGSDWLSQYMDLQQIIDCINDFPRLLRQVALLWPAVRVCADTVAILAEPVLRRLHAICRYGEPPPRDDVTSNILAGYLFPDSALAAEQRTVGPDFDHIDVLGMGDLPLNMPGMDMEDFDWAMGPLNQPFFSLDFI